MFVYKLKKNRIVVAANKSVFGNFFEHREGTAIHTLLIRLVICLSKVFGGAR